MTFSNEWDENYKRGQHLSTWPWSDLVSLVYQHAAPSFGFERVLELGCGAGANIPFFQALEVDYFAVDGSIAVIDILHQRFPDLSDQLRVADFTLELPFDCEFDLVVDRSSLISNTTEAMIRGMRLAADRMRPGGRFIAVDWFSTLHEGFHLGDRVDEYTRTGFPNTSDLAGIGHIHFCDQPHIETLARESGLRILTLDHKTVQTRYPSSGPTRSWWNFVAEKPKV